MYKANRIAVRFFLGTSTVVAAFIVGRYSAPDTVHPVDSSNDDDIVQKVVSRAKEPTVRLEYTVEDSSAQLIFELSKMPRGNAGEMNKLIDSLIAWAKEDPHGALSFVAKRLNPLPQREFATTAILTEWASHAPEQAWEWAQSNSRNDLIELLSAIAKVDPEMAWENAYEYTNQHPEDTYQSYVSTLNGVIHSGNYTLGIDLIDSLDLPYTSVTKNGKHTFILPTVSQWVRFSPEAVAEWISSLPDAHDSAKKSLAHEALLLPWSYSDPIATLEYARTLPANMAKTAALNNSIHHLLDIGEVTTVGEWLNEHGQGEEYDLLISDMATRKDVMGNNTDMAIEWASSIVDPVIRESGLIDIAADLLAEDPEKAKEYFEGKELLSAEAWKTAQTHAIDRARVGENQEDHDPQLFEQYN